MATKKKASTARKSAKPVKTAVTVTVHQAEGEKDVKVKLPKALVKVARDNSLNIKVEKLARGLLPDQRARLMSSDGCISNPGGPSC